MQNNFKKIIVSCLVFVAIIGLVVWYANRRTMGVSKSNNIKVVTSMYPLEEIARAVGGEKISVKKITPNGLEPHDYEPTPADITTLQSANLVLVNGAGMEPWSEKIKPDLEKQGVKLLNLTQTFSLSDMIANSQGQLDPHIWLNPQLFQKEIESVRDALISLDSANANFYAENARRYSAEIAALDAQFLEGLKSCAFTDFITAHNAFEYLAIRYHLTPHGIVGFSPDEEPSARGVAELVAYIRKQKIKYVLIEPLSNDKFAKTLAKEANIQILTLNPIEGLTADEIKQGATYQTIMKKNLDTLRTALACK